MIALALSVRYRMIYLFSVKMFQSVFLLCELTIIKNQCSRNKFVSEQQNTNCLLTTVLTLMF